MAKEAKGEMFWRSTCRAEQKEEHRTKGDLTFSKTSITIMKPLPKNDFRKATKVFGENRTRDKVANDMTKDVNVSLTISRNQNASISASCFFPHKQHPALPNRNRPPTSAEEDKKAPFIGQQKSPLLKVVEIPFEENMRRQQFLPLAKSVWEKKDGHWQSKKRDDYRVVSLDVKPIPGRLEDFIPEIERKQHDGMRGISRTNQAVLDNRKSDNPDQSKNGIIFGKKGGMGDKCSDYEAPLERDECGRVLIPQEEWRKFLAEQRPQTSVPLKTRLQIIYNKDKYNFTAEREKPEIIVAESNVKDVRNIATFPRKSSLNGHKDGKGKE